MCMWIGYNPCINFFSLFPLCELCHFLTSDSMKVYRQWVPCGRNSSSIFILIFLKLCTCFLHGLEMCMWFGYNPWINFCHFFSLCELCHFLTSDFMKVYRQWVPCKRNSLYNFIPYIGTSLFHGLKMCMWFGFNPAVNFCHFSTLLYPPPRKTEFKWGILFFQHVRDSEILSFNQHLRLLLYNFNSFCLILCKFTPHLNHQTMHVW